MARRRFAREFKLSAVKLVNEQGYSPAEAGRSLGVDPNSVRGWVAKSPADAGVALSRRAKRSRPSCGGCARRYAAADAELEILKKAAAFFAKEPS